jgi:hypothetical protein
MKSLWLVKAIHFYFIILEKKRKEEKCLEC